MPRETDLYPILKALFEAQGYAVKGEVGAADIMAVKPGEPPVLVETKLGFSLALFHQAVERLKLTERVYVAVPRPKGRKAFAQNKGLCRRLGLGLIVIDLDRKRAEVVADPGPYAPRQAKKKAAKLVEAFHKRLGDPNEGGATRHGIVTNYRQDALRCAAYLAEYGASKGQAVARDTGVPTATRIMADNHYGWFLRVETGVYALTDAGRTGLADWDGALPDGA
jgi:hypothetical protein